MNNKKIVEEFITANIDGAYRFAFTYMKNQADAEDVVSESVIKALKSWDKLKNPGYVKTWFYRIIINTALTQLQKKQKVTLYDSLTPPVELHMEDDLSYLSFQEMIEKLDTKHKTVVVLRFFEGMTLEEISQVLDENINTVKSRLYRSLRMLRLEMEGDL